MDALTRKINELVHGSWVIDPNTGRWVDYPQSDQFIDFGGSGSDCDLRPSLEDVTPLHLLEKLLFDPDGKNEQTHQESKVERRRKGLQAEFERNYYVPLNPFYQRIEDLSPEHRELYANYTSAALGQMKNSRFYPGANLLSYQDRFMRLDQLNSTVEMMARAKQLGMDIFKTLLYLKAADDAYGCNPELLSLKLKYRYELSDAKKQLENVLDGVRRYLSIAVNKKVQNFFKQGYSNHPLAALAIDI